MSDRFKFRAWDSNEMIYYNLLKPVDYCLEWMLQGSYKTDTNIMQCTGLKDKNGALIYEGDIMRSHFEWRDDISTVLQIVKWVDKDAQFMAEDLPDVNDRMGRLHPCWWGKNCAVIGNIHENQELLEQHEKQS